MADPELLRLGPEFVVTADRRCTGAARSCNRVVARWVVSIAFTDGGPGIPRDVLEKIFTPFFTTKARGTGLGLPTAKRIVEAHHGRLSVACPPEGGTTVTVALPVSETL